MKKNLFSRILTGLSLLVVVIALSACSLFQGESVDGDWTSHELAAIMYDNVAEASGEIFTYSDHSIQEILTKAEFNANIKDDKAAFEIVLFVDEEAFFTAMKDEQEAAIRQAVADAGGDYDSMSDEQKALVGAQKQSDDEIRELVKTTIDLVAASVDGTYSAEKGYIQTTLFKADVDRVAETFDITEITSVRGKDFATAGESYVYSYKDGKLTLEGETDKDDLVLEKKQ